MKITSHDLSVITRNLNLLSLEKVFGLEIALNLSNLEEIASKFQTHRKKLDEQFEEFDFEGEAPKNMRDSAKAKKKKIAWIYKKKMTGNNGEWYPLVFKDDENKYVVATPENAESYDTKTFASLNVNPERFEDYNAQIVKLVDEHKEEFNPVVINTDEVKEVAASKGLNGSILAVLIKYGIIEK